MQCILSDPRIPIPDQSGYHRLLPTFLPCLCLPLATALVPLIPQFFQVLHLHHATRLVDLPKRCAQRATSALEVLAPHALPVCFSTGIVAHF